MISPTRARLHEVFDLNAETGLLVWKPRPAETFASPLASAIFSKRYAEKPAGYISDGYRRIRLDGGKWHAHRLVWLFVHDELLEAGDEIDHIDGNRSNNRPRNLRKVTRGENCRNKSVQADNTSGVTGVSWDTARRNWRAQIKVGNRQKYLGCFKNLADAALARANAERSLGFHPGHGKARSLPR